MDRLTVADTSVFVADALSLRRTGSSSAVLNLASEGRLHLLLCGDIRSEITHTLTRILGWPENRTDDYFGTAFDRAIWLEPVPEESHHLAAVQGHSADAVVVRLAEAIYTSNRPDLVRIPDKYVVSLNTRHFPPGAAYAGFVFVTPHDLLG